MGKGGAGGGWGVEVVWQNSSRDPSAGMDMCLLLDGSLSVTVMGTTLKKINLFWQIIKLNPTSTIGQQF